MPLASMTGYARGRGAMGDAAFTLEIKSVNARGLDLRMRLPPGYDALEPEIRRRLGAALSRGAVSVSLTVERPGATVPVIVNEAALTTVLAALERLADRVDAKKPTLDGILRLPGVLTQRDHVLDSEAEAALHAAILTLADDTIADLLAARRAEGARLAAILRDRLDEIGALTKAAELHPGRGRDAILERLRRQLADLEAAGAAMPEDRLAQEALILATKADIREELDRLAAHLVAARQLIAEGGPVGRKLDFLAQEFNREANTLCAKSNAVELTGIGLDLKAVIDQLREQVQNIE